VREGGAGFRRVVGVDEREEVQGRERCVVLEAVRPPARLVQEGEISLEVGAIDERVLRLDEPAIACLALGGRSRELALGDVAADAAKRWRCRSRRGP
jgi:hypothetical protein